MSAVLWTTCVFALLQTVAQSSEAMKNCTYRVNVMDIYYSRFSNFLSTFTFDWINNSTDFLPDVCFVRFPQLTAQDDIGAATNAYMSFINQLPMKHVIFGPASSSQAEVLGAVGRYTNIPMVGASWLPPTLSDRKTYALVTRVNAGIGLNNNAILKILNHFSWSRISWIYKDNLIITPIATAFGTAAIQQKLTVAYSSSYTLSATYPLLKMQEIDSRINVAFTIRTANTTDRLECFIYDTGYYGKGYQWIYSGLPYLLTTISSPCNKTAQWLASEGILFVQSEAQLWQTTNVSAISYGPKFVGDILNYINDTGIMVSDFSGSTVDAVWALAYAIDKIMNTVGPSAITNLNNYPNSTWGQTFYSSILNVSFHGISGPVSFDAIGDRVAPVLVYQVQNGSLVVVGSYDYYKDTLIMNGTVWFPNGLVPYDSIQYRLTSLDISAGLYYTFCVMAVLGILGCVACIVFNHVFGYLRFIKMSSPKMNNLIAVGCALCYADVILLGIDNDFATSDSASTALCMFRVILLLLGFDLAYGAMFVKSWRVHIIFSNRSLARRSNLKDWHLIVKISVIILMDVIVVVVWLAIDPLDIITRNVTFQPTVNGIINVPRVKQCISSQALYFMGTLYVLKGLLLLFGIFFVWETRKVHVEMLNDSKQIGVCIYNIVIIAVITVPLQYILTADQLDISFSLLAVGIFVCAGATLGLVFGPKIAAVAKHGNKVDDATQGPFTANNSIASPSSDGKSSTVTI